MFEVSSCCKLHIDPSTNKCKLLPLARWKRSLEQKDIPIPCLKIIDHLDYLGYNHYANFSATRCENGEILKLWINSIRILNWHKTKKCHQVSTRLKVAKISFETKTHYCLNLIKVCFVLSVMDMADNLILTPWLTKNTKNLDAAKYF